jgi:hypothetical protein
MKLNFEVIQTAGLTAGDLQKIVEIPKPFGGTTSISRTAAFNWTRGGQPSPYAYEYVSRLLEAIGNAVAAKDLPLPLDTKRKDRIAKLKAVIAKHLVVYK